jgi:hypothetical protein
MGIISAILLVSVCVSAYGQEDTKDLSAYYGFKDMEIIKLDWGINELLIADFNRDGGNDIAAANNRKAKIELLIQKEKPGPEEAEMSVDPEDIDINQIKAITRFDNQSISVSEKVYSLVGGDLNNDGLEDLAYYGEPKGLYILLQKDGSTDPGKSMKLSWRTKKKIKIETGLSTQGALASGDLNNDGFTDLALAGRDEIYIVLQKTDGTLAEPVKYPATARVLGVKIIDLNGDRINDLILATSDTEKPIHVRFGLETGQLGPQEQFVIEKPYAIAFYNIDGNNGDEILTVNAKSGRLICYEFKSNNIKDMDWPVLFYPLAAGEGSAKRDMVVADFDGDGQVDITISDPGAAELILYRQLENTGLAEPVRFPALSDIDSMSVADIDSDKRNELVVLSIKEKIIGVSKYENERLTFPKPIDLIDEPVAMTLGDMNNDNLMDYLYISKDSNNLRTLRISYNSTAIDIEENDPNLKQSAILYGDSALELPKLDSNPQGMKVVDVDLDGLRDVLIFAPYEEPILVRQGRKGKFSIVDSPNAQASLIKDASMRSIAIADVDGQSGEELLIAQKNFARSLVFEGGKTWKIIDQYNAKSTENEITAVGVFNIDLISKQNPAILILDGQRGQIQILKAGDDKIYRFEKELEVGKWNTTAQMKMAYAPLTGTGSKSILLFDSEKFALITPPNKDNSPHYFEQLFDYETKIKDGVYGNIGVGDLNSDGQADIIMVDYKGNHMEILAMDAEMKPVSAFPWKIFEQKSFQRKKGGKAAVEPREIKVADVTGDGKDDLITLIHDRIIIYPQD